MKITKTEFDQETHSLMGFGLLPEEIEAYFEFFDQAMEVQKNKRVRVLNSRQIKTRGKTNDF